MANGKYERDKKVRQTRTQERFKFPEEKSSIHQFLKESIGKNETENPRQPAKNASIRDAHGLSLNDRKNCHHRKACEPDREP